MAKTAASVRSAPQSQIMVAASADETAEDIILHALKPWTRGVRRRTLKWSARKEDEKKRQAAESELPPQRLQILRALATLVAVSSDDVEHGYTATQILAFGLALYPDSLLFQEADGSIVIPTTKLLTAKLSGQGEGTLQYSGYIRCLHESTGVKNTIGDGERTRLRVHLTTKGAQSALDDGWLPPLAGYMQTLLRRAQRRMSLGVLTMV